MIDSCGHYVDSEVYKYMNRFDLGLDDLVNYKETELWKQFLWMIGIIEW